MTWIPEPFPWTVNLIDELSRHSLRKQLRYGASGYLDQIRHCPGKGQHSESRDASDDEIIRAAKDGSQAGNFIRRLPERLDTVLT